MKNQKPHKAQKITLPAKENIYQAFEFMCQHQSTNYYKYACTDSLFKTSVFSNPRILTYTSECTPIIPSLRLCVLFSLVHAVACGHRYTNVKQFHVQKKNCCNSYVLQPFTFTYQFLLWCLIELWGEQAWTLSGREPLWQCTVCCLTGQSWWEVPPLLYRSQRERKRG